MLSLNLGVAIFREGAKNAQAETKKCDAKKCTKKSAKKCTQKNAQEQIPAGGENAKYACALSPHPAIFVPCQPRNAEFCLELGSGRFTTVRNAKIWKGNTFSLDSSLTSNWHLEARRRLEVVGNVMASKGKWGNSGGTRRWFVMQLWRRPRPVHMRRNTLGNSPLAVRCSFLTNWHEVASKTIVRRKAEAPTCYLEADAPIFFHGKSIETTAWDQYAFMSKNCFDINACPVNFPQTSPKLKTAQLAVWTLNMTQRCTFRAWSSSPFFTAPLEFVVGDTEGCIVGYNTRVHRGSAV